MKVSYLQPGTVLFKRYQIRQWLEVGEQSSVYLCQDKKGGDAYVVLKVLDKKFASSKLQQRFVSEIELIKNFSHPNIIKIDEVLFDRRYLAYRMQYVRSGSLADRLHPDEPTAMHDIVLYFSQICRAVAAIHRAGVIHRDLKPENILIDQEGYVWVCDFGISAANSDGNSEYQRGITGTISYCSPEYVQHGQCDQRSDIYALGAILYELLTGSLPFHGQPLLESIRMKVNVDPAPAVMLREDCQPELSEICQKAMQRDPNNRYQSVESLIADLEQFYTPFRLAFFSNNSWNFKRAA